MKINTFIVTFLATDGPVLTQKDLKMKRDCEI